VSIPPTQKEPTMPIKQEIWMVPTAGMDILQLEINSPPSQSSSS